MKSNIDWTKLEIDEAINLLAITYIDAREKRAGIEDEAKKLAKPFTDQLVSSAREDLVRPMFNDYSDKAMKHLGWTLGGAAAGGLLGAGSQLFAPKKKRRYASGILTGGLLGAGAGLSTSLLKTHWNDMFGKKVENDSRANAEVERIKAEKEEREKTNTTNPELEQLAQVTGIDPGPLTSARIRHSIVGDEAIREYLQDAKTWKWGFRAMPSDKQEIIQKLKSRGQVDLDQYGFPLQELEKIDPSKPEQIKAFYDRVINSYGQGNSPYMRMIKDKTGKIIPQPWTDRGELERLDLAKIRENALNYKDFYAWDQPGLDEETKFEMAKRRILDPATEFTAHPLKRRANFVRGWATDAANKLDNSEYLGAAIKATEPVHGNLKLIHRNNAGLLPEIRRGLLSWKGQLASENVAKAQKYLEPYGLRVGEVLEAYREGEQHIDDLIERAVQEGRTYKTPDGRLVKWDKESLRRDMPSIIEGTAEQADFKAPEYTDWMKYPTLGNTTADLYTLLALDDLQGSMRDIRLSWKGKNPADILKTISDGKIPTNIANNEELVKYLQHASRFGEEGIKNIQKDPLHYAKLNDKLRAAEKLKYDFIDRVTKGGLSGIDNTVNKLQEEYKTLQNGYGSDVLARRAAIEKQIVDLNQQRQNLQKIKTPVIDQQIDALRKQVYGLVQTSGGEVEPLRIKALENLNKAHLNAPPKFSLEVLENRLNELKLNPKVNFNQAKIDTLLNDIAEIKAQNLSPADQARKLELMIERGVTGGPARMAVNADEIAELAKIPQSATPPPQSFKQVAQEMYRVLNTGGAEKLPGMKEVVTKLISKGLTAEEMVPVIEKILLNPSEQIVLPRGAGTITANDFGSETFKQLSRASKYRGDTGWGFLGNQFGRGKALLPVVKHLPRGAALLSPALIQHWLLTAGAPTPNRAYRPTGQ